MLFIIIDDRIAEKLKKVLSNEKKKKKRKSKKVFIQ